MIHSIETNTDESWASEVSRLENENRMLREALEALSYVYVVDFAGYEDTAVFECVDDARTAASNTLDANCGSVTIECESEYASLVSGDAELISFGYFQDGSQITIQRVKVE